MKNLSVDEIGWVDPKYSQVYESPSNLSGEEGCSICRTVLGWTADRVGS